VLIFDVNPFMTGADFNPEAVHRLKVDNNGDTQADVAFSFAFSESSDGAQTGTVYYSTGSEAREPEPVGEVLIEGMPVGFDAMAESVDAGECRLFIGVRSDPFFADGEGAFHDFQFTGDDTFAGKNILAMLMTESTDEGQILHLATSSVGGLARCRPEGVYLTGQGWRWTAGSFRQETGRRAVERQLAGLGSLGGAVEVPGRSWGWAYPLRSLAGGVGFLIVSAEEAPGPAE